MVDKGLGNMINILLPVTQFPGGIFYHLLSWVQEVTEIEIKITFQQSIAMLEPPLSFFLVSVFPLKRFVYFFSGFVKSYTICKNLLKMQSNILAVVVILPLKVFL